MPESDTTPPMQVPGRTDPASPRYLTPDELAAEWRAAERMAWRIAAELCRDRRRFRPVVEVVQNAVWYAVYECGRGFDDAFGPATVPRSARFQAYTRRAGKRAGIDCIEREYASAETPTDGGDAAEWVAAPSPPLPPDLGPVLARLDRLERTVIVGLRDKLSLADLAARTGHPVARLQAAYESATVAVRNAMGIDAG